VNHIEKILREEAKRLFEEKKIDMLIGFEQGTLPLTATPLFITKSEDVERLVWNPACSVNLSKYLHGILHWHRESQTRLKPEQRKKKVIGIVANGCTTRSIIVHQQENQYSKDDILIVGVPCIGVIDIKKVQKRVGDEEIIDGSFKDEKIIVKTSKRTEELPLEEFLSDSCVTCICKNPVISDVTVGEPVEQASDNNNEFLTVEEFLKKSHDERWEYFKKQVEKCIRCYACRNACPLCYCKDCFIEQTKPKWVGTTDDISDTMLFHITRAFHTAGRCVDCGACALACPVGVDIRRFLKKLNKDCLELFHHRAGMDLEKKSPLSTYDTNDPQNFITEP